MKKQSIIRVLMVVIIITAAVFVVASVRAKSPVSASEECMQDKQDCMETKSQSEFLLESLTRNLLRR